MATIKICDICERRIAEDAGSFEVNTKVRKRGALVDWDSTYYDICPECMDKVNTALLTVVEEARKDA